MDMRDPKLQADLLREHVSYLPDPSLLHRVQEHVL